MVTKKHLPRRIFLQGVGATIALPYLDAMTPAFAAAEKPVTRAAFVYTANGIIMNDWTPAETGSNFAISKTLKPIETFRDQTVVVSGLAHRNGEALGDGPGDHARAGASWLTGAHPKKTQGADIRNGQSIDQLLAQQIGQTTPLPSLEIGLQDVRMVGGCDSGYSCAYSNTIHGVLRQLRFLMKPIPEEYSNDYSVMVILLIRKHALFNYGRTEACWISCCKTLSVLRQNLELQIEVSYLTIWIQYGKSNVVYKMSNKEREQHYRLSIDRKGFLLPSKIT